MGFQSNKTGKAIKTRAQRTRTTNYAEEMEVFSAFSTPCVAHCGVFVQKAKEIFYRPSKCGKRMSAACSDHLLTLDFLTVMQVVDFQMFY